MSEYRPLEFWREAGKTYLAGYEHNDVYQKQEAVLLNYLRNMQVQSGPIKSVLELGCGFGRLTNLLINDSVDMYVGVDVSADQLSHIKPRKNLILQNTDILSFKTNMSFDLVLSAEVLMHQLPSDMPAIIEKMKALGKHVINIDYYCDEQIELSNWNFMHDYPKLYGNAEMIQIDRQALFHWSKSSSQSNTSS